MKWVLAYGATALVFVALDFVWLTMIARSIYQSELRELLATNLNYAAAAAFYAIYVVGIVVLAVHPALQANSLVLACVSGAVLGLVAYATYDLTNLATLKTWSMKVAVLDMGWGTLLTAVAAGAGYIVASRST